MRGREIDLWSSQSIDVNNSSITVISNEKNHNMKNFNVVLRTIPSLSVTPIGRQVVSEIKRSKTWLFYELGCISDVVTKLSSLCNLVDLKVKIIILIFIKYSRNITKILLYYWRKLLQKNGYCKMKTRNKSGCGFGVRLWRPSNKAGALNCNLEGGL